MKKHRCIHIVSDSQGETAHNISKALFSQFPKVNISFKRYPFVNTKNDIDKVINDIKTDQCLIVFTIVIEEIANYLMEEAKKRNIDYIDIMGSALNRLSKFLGEEPSRISGQQLDVINEEYFKRIEAIEFAVKYDDGKDPRGILDADIVLIGVSRTSKTPLSMYLANRGYKVANIPLVPEVDPPNELFQVDRRRVVGLVADPMTLNAIREERLIAMGLADYGSNYARVERIREELLTAEKIMVTIGCFVIDVSRKAIEESAGKIIERMVKFNLEKK